MGRAQPPSPAWAPPSLPASKEGKKPAARHKQWRHGERVPRPRSAFIPPAPPALLQPALLQPALLAPGASQPGAPQVVAQPARGAFLALCRVLPASARRAAQAGPRSRGSRKGILSLPKAMLRCQEAAGLGVRSWRALGGRQGAGAECALRKLRGGHMGCCWRGGKARPSCCSCCGAAGCRRRLRARCGRCERAGAMPQRR